MENAESAEDRRAREIIVESLEAALRSADPLRLIEKHLHLDGDVLKIDDAKFDIRSAGRIIVIGAGKGAGGLAVGLERLIGWRIDAGLVNIPYGVKSKLKTERIELNEAGHPTPDESGVRGVERILELTKDLDERDLVFCLITGGGSALLSLPAEGISLKDKAEAADALMKAGASIQELNTVRKHLSSVKGGRLAQRIHPARIVNLIVSDVVGDPLEIIASGPTVPDSSTFQDALRILEKYQLLDKVSEPVRRVILEGVSGRIKDSPKPDDPAFNKDFNVLLGSNCEACLAAAETAARRGMNTLFLTSFLEGEAREAGIFLASIIREVHRSGRPAVKPCMIICGGETTVTVRCGGRGGRNQEVVLSSALKLAGMKGVAIASIGTDGVDGPTDAAGAVADGRSIERGRRLGLDAEMILHNNDSYRFFSELEDLIMTGPTGTNVNDVTLLALI